MYVGNRQIMVGVDIVMVWHANMVCMGERACYAVHVVLVLFCCPGETTTKMSIITGMLRIELAWSWGYQRTSSCVCVLPLEHSMRNFAKVWSPITNWSPTTCVWGLLLWLQHPTMHNQPLHVSKRAALSHLIECMHLVRLVMVGYIPPSLEWSEHDVCPLESSPWCPIGIRRIRKLGMWSIYHGGGTVPVPPVPVTNGMGISTHHYCLFLCNIGCQMER